MTYISRINLNKSRKATKEMLSNPRKVHHLVEQSFSEKTKAGFDETTGRVLWRFDTKSYDPELLVISPVIPDFAHIVEEAGRANDPDGVTIRDYNPMLESLRNGERRLFSVQVNPVKRTAKGTIPHVTAKWIGEWFAERAEGSGFLVDSRAIEVVENRPIVIHRSEGAGVKNVVTLASAQVRGELVVSDAMDLRSTLRSGFGRGKAYGLGMLTIAGAQ